VDDRDSIDPTRSPWREGPDEGTSPDSWLGLADDELLHTIETVSSQRDADERLLEVVASHRHFFIRQEAAKRIRRKKLLFPYEDDRHIGQILVRHLTRREDLTYLERLVARSKHGEVRKAAHVQLARLRTRLEDQERRDATRQAQGKAPWRVAVVHAAPAVRAAVTETLSTPNYDVRSHDGAAAEADILAFEPHLLLAGPKELLEAGLHATLRRGGRAVPAVALCDPQDAARLPEMVGKGVDEYMLLPVLPALLAAKAQALLHLAHIAPSQMEHRKASGPIGEEGVVPLLKLCEDEQLTCRLVVTSEGSRWFADFVAGEMTEAGGAPPLGDDEALAAILAVRSGSYEMIEAIHPDDEEIDTTPAVVAAASVLSTPSAIPPTPTAAPAPEWSLRDVDATLLGWAVHFIVEQAWSRLGTAATAGLLRRTLHDGASRHPILKLFNIEDNAHVGIDLSQGARVATEAVGVTAQWMAVFIAAVRRIAPEAAAIDVRKATRIVGAALEQVDFYLAYDRAAAQQQRETKPATIVIGKIDLKRPR
jgi:hypothetical protein